jgi:hypothetical protein
MVHRLFTTGDFYFEHGTVGQGEAAMTQKTPGRPNQLHGMLGFIDGIDLHSRKITPNGKTLSSKELMYRRFLMFKELYAAPAPVVICEGKTDNVYITHAIRSLAAQYPKLADINSSTGKIFIKFRRFKYTGNSTGRILGIAGGTGHFGRFIVSYKADILRFKAPGMQWPIMLLIDNDSGREPIFNTIKSITGRKPDRSDPYVHIFGNLYLVTTPLPGGTQQSNIEDCFDDATKNTVLGGKTFNPENEYNTKTHYGKADFAYKVVKPNADRIDFTGFKSILDRFVSVLDEHAKRFGHPMTP